jgi:hypothetical protein
MNAHEGFKLYQVWLAVLAGAGGWEGIRRTLKAFFGTAIESMPPLPANATWGQKWLYATLKAIATPGKIATILATAPEAAKP